MKQLLNLIFVSILLTSCGDSESKYITSIDNNSDYEIVVKISNDSTVLCPSNQETIIEDYWGGSLKKMSCATPYIFAVKKAEVMIDDSSKILTKDIYDDINWTCRGEEEWSLVMVGNYYSEIETTLTINNDDIKNVE